MAAALAAACAAGSAIGCAAPHNPFRFTEPPTAVDPRNTLAHTSPSRNERKTVIVVGAFADPSKAPNYSRGVGRFMSEAYSRALLNDGNYDVWINPTLTRAVQQVVFDQPPPEQAAELARLHAEHKEVRYVVLGKVTDFHHTGDLPGQVSRWGLLGPRNEAIVAIDFRIVDMRTRRVVGAEHITQAVSAGRSPSEELYGGVALDSYLFWSTPLGRASKDVIERAVARTEVVVPPMLGDPQIERTIAHRRVSIIGGAQAGLANGQELYVLRQPHGESRWVPIRDADTGRPLRVRIESVTRTNATAWVMGERPRDVSLRGALLAAELPRESGKRPEHATGLSHAAGADGR